MHENNPERGQDDDLTALLAAFDAELAVGSVSPEKTPGDDLGAPAPLKDRLQAAKRCLTLLEKLWPRSKPDAAGPPQTIGRFVIVAELGRGGFGIVYLAQDDKLGRQVALKVQRPEAILSPVLRQRFLREARAAARLRHANIAAIYEVGEAGFQAWVASEFCPAGSLASWLRANVTGAPPQDAAHFVASLADAVEYSHQAGVLHRDLKPNNVLLQFVGASDATRADGLAAFVPKLIDFGLAKLQEGPQCETQSHSIVGTPAYMSPEQANGQADQTGPATDIYGLGAILYELLTASAVVQGKNYADTLRKIVAEEPVAIRAIRKEIPRDLEAICLKCLAKDPKGRYHSAGAVAADLRRYLQRKPTLARPAGPIERALKFARRRPTLVALTATSALAIATIVVSSLLAASNLKAERDVAKRIRAMAERRTAEVERLVYPLRLQSVLPALTNWKGHDALQVLEASIAGFKKEQPDFVWKYLARQAQLRTIATIQAHQGNGYAVVYSPDGHWLASAGADRTVRIWDTQTQSRVAELDGHWDEVNALEFSPDGVWLVSASDDRTLRVWRVADWTHAATLSGHLARVGDTAFSPDGRWLASGSEDGRVQVWDTSHWQLVTAFDGIKGDISLSFVPWAKELIVGGRDVPAKRRSTVTWEPLGDLDSEMRQVTHSHIHRWRAFFRGFPYQLNCWSEVREKYPQQWSRSERVFDGLSFSRDDGILATASDDGIVRLRDSTRGTMLAAIRVETKHVRGLDFSPTNDRLAVIGDSGRIHVIDLRGLSPARRIVGLRQPVSNVRFSPAGDRLATCDEGGTLRLWDTKTWDLANARTYDRGPLAHVSFSPDGRRLAITCGLGEPVQIIDEKSLDELPSPESVFNSREWVDYSPDGQWLAGIGTRGHLMLCRPDTEEVQVDLERSAAARYGEARSVVDQAGNLVVVWQESQESLPSTIRAGRVDSQRGSLASSMVIASDVGARAFPAIATQPGGGFVIVWNHDSRIVGRRFDDRLRPLGDEFVVSQSGNCARPVLGMSASGSFMVAWHRLAGDPTSGGVRARLFSAHATSIADELEVAAPGEAIAQELAVVLDKNGQSIIAWLRAGAKDNRGPVVARQYSPDGVPRGDAFELWERLARSVKMAAQPSGNLLVLCELGDAKREILGRIYTPQLQALDPVILVGTCASPGNLNVSVSPDGDFVLAWNEVSADFSDTHIIARRFRADGLGLTDAFFLARHVGRESPAFTSALVKHADLVAVRGVSTGTDENCLRTWIAKDIQNRFRCFDSYNSIAAFSPSGKLIVGVDQGRSICVWEPGSGQILARLPGNALEVVSAAFSPNDRFLATGFANGEIAIWNLTKNAPEQTWGAHSGPISTIHFSPDGQVVMTGGVDSLVKLWTVPDGNKLASLGEHTGPVLSAAFAPDGRQLVTAGKDRDGSGEILIWETDESESPRGEVQRPRVEGSHAHVPKDPDIPHEVRALLLAAARTGRGGSPFRTLLGRIANWARERGFATSLPGFQELGVEGVLMTDLLLLRDRAVELGAMPGDLIDIGNDDQQIIKSVNAWSKEQGHAAAILNYAEEGPNTDGQRAVYIIRPEFVLEKQIPRAELSPIRESDLPSRISALTKWAQDHGYLGAWPTFNDDQSTCGAVLFKPEAGHRSHYPLSN